jgi:hypothetical protein
MACRIAGLKYSAQTRGGNKKHKGTKAQIAHQPIIMLRHMMKVVQECSGIGELILNGAVLRRVPYRISRFQGMMPESGLPIPGLHRIEGAIEFNHDTNPDEWIGVPLSLKLEDGGVLGITLVDRTGRVFSEGHGPSKCLCC